MSTEPQKRPDIAPDFTIGDWLVEPSLDRVSRNGTARRLRPQLIDLLVVLARHAGRTVSKDVILAEVWQRQHVAESGLTRCITEIRQALEDDAHTPWVVQTIPKRGYRLVAPVVFLPTHAAVDAVPAPPVAVVAAEPGALGLEERAPGVEPIPPAVEPSIAAGEPNAKEPAPRRRRGIVGWSVGSFFGILLVAAGVWSVAAGSAPPVLGARDTVLLADVANHTGDPTFDGTLKLALAVHLGQAPFLHILSDEHVRTALSLTGRPHNEPISGALALELCRREGAAVLLAASISRLGTNYAVGIEATACRSGEAIARELVEVDGKDRVLDALGSAAARLRRKLGESRASLRTYDVPIVEATTPSLEALQALSVGDFNRDHARLDEALNFYRRATEIDPQFALAWARRGAVAKNLGRPEEAIPAFRRAYDLHDRVSEPERLYILAHYYRSVAGDPERAADTYRIWQRAYPGSAVPATNLASIYLNEFGDYEAALGPAREAVRLAPYSSVALRMLVGAALGSGRIEEARQAMRAASDRGVADVFWHIEAYQLAFADGDTTAMQVHARWAAENPRAMLAMAQRQALAAASLGKLHESRRIFAGAAETAAQTAPPIRRAAMKALEAQVEALLGDPTRARAAVHAALADSRDAGTTLSAAIALGIAGDAGGASALVAEAVRAGEAGMPSHQVALAVARALIEADAGRYEAALNALSAVTRFERGREHGLMPLGVRGWLELDAGRPKEAAATFQALLQLRLAVPTSPWVPFARVGLARALAAAGDVPGSRAAFDAALESLRHADADAPLLLSARRVRAAAIPE